MKKLLLGLLPLVLLLVLLELVLWAAGWGQSGVRLSMSRGFDREAAYIVPDPGVPGGWVTQMFESEAQEVRVAPKGTRRRLLLMGGSNVQGFPDATLQRMLTDANPLVGWEVVNLGRAGYGSERVSILLTQALDRLEPDAVLLYSGHNEFMERGFAEELEAEGALGWKGDLAEALMGLRSMNLAMDLVRPEPREYSFDTAPGPRPEPRIVGRVQVFRQIDYATTLVYYDAFRSNIESMCREVVSRQLPLVLCTVVGNDFMPPYQTKIGPLVPPQTRQRILSQRPHLWDKIPERFRGGLRPPVRLSQHDWGLTLSDTELEARRAAAAPRPSRLPVLRRMRGKFAATPATHVNRLSSIEGAHWSDPQLWTPRVFDLMKTMQAIHRPALNRQETMDLRQVREALEAVLELAPNEPLVLWDLGLVQCLLGDMQAARQSLIAATDHDRAPRRGGQLVNDLIRSVKRDVPHVELFDAAKFFRAQTPDGLLGYELLTDVCHFQPGVRPVLMREFVRVVLKATHELQVPRKVPRQVPRQVPR